MTEHNKQLLRASKDYLDRDKKQRLSSLDIITARHYMSKDISTYNKRSLARTVGGVVLIGVGVGTFLIPFTTIPLCVAGAVLIGYDLKALIVRYKYEKNLIKLRCLMRLGVWR